MSNVLKYSPKHEQIIIGTCLRHADILQKLIRRTDIIFSVEQHRLIWAGLQTMYERKLKYTPGTLTTILPSEGWNGQQYLRQLEKMAEHDNIAFHIQRLSWDIARVELYSKELADLTNTLKDPTAEPNDAKRYTTRLHQRLDAIRENDPIVKNEQLVAKTQAIYRARRIAGSSFKPSGFPAIDKELGEGFANQKISVIAGESSTGKSTFALNLAREQALRQNMKVAILSWESGIQYAIDSMCAAELKIALPKFTKYAKRITDDEQNQIDDFVEQILKTDKITFLRKPPKKILRGPPWDVVDRLMDWIEEQFERLDCDVIYWDMLTKKMPSESPDLITRALNRVQDMVDPEDGTVNSHIVLLQQINLKTLEKERPDKRPTRGLLKGTGGWVETPDNVFTLYRPGLHEVGLEDNIIEITCWKQRRGAFPWRVNMTWNGVNAKISDGQRVNMQQINPAANTHRRGGFHGRI